MNYGIIRLQLILTKRGFMHWRTEPTSVEAIMIWNQWLLSGCRAVTMLLEVKLMFSGTSMFNHRVGKPDNCRIVIRIDNRMGKI